MTQLDIHGLTREELLAAARELLPQGAGVASRVYRQVMLEGRFEPETLGLSARTAAAWREHFRFELPEVQTVAEEDTPVGLTAKAVLRLADGYEAECVHIPMGRGRHTLCISSQVGCKMGCTFCETARMGLLRHMTSAEIVGQLLVARHRLGWDVGNIVFMGMGEALDNPDGVLQALRVMNDSGGLAMAQEAFTVCTVGNVAGLDRLATLGFKRLNVSVSLNAANDTLRSRIMPVNRKTPLAELQRALAAYRPRRNFALG
ncbi:MAG: radical SAM protein, partial [Polyangiaceae bacterium]|nr:radical SAM protein [Polyangiaceae bacterium]